MQVSIFLFFIFICLKSHIIIKIHNGFVMYSRQHQIEDISVTIFFSRILRCFQSIINLTRYDISELQISQSFHCLLDSLILSPWVWVERNVAVRSSWDEKNVKCFGTIWLSEWKSRKDCNTTITNRFVQWILGSIAAPKPAYSTWFLSLAKKNWRGHVYRKSISSIFL